MTYQDEPPKDLDPTIGDQEFIEGLNTVQQRLFAAAVTKATEQATQNIARIHRRRLVTQAAAAASVIVALVAVVVILWVTNADKGISRADALGNCKTLTAIAQIVGNGNTSDLRLHGRPEGLISSFTEQRVNEQLTSAQIAKLHHGALRALATDPETRRLTKRDNAEAKANTKYWEHVLVAKLKNIASQNCDRAIK